LFQKFKSQAAGDHCRAGGVCHPHRHGCHAVFFRPDLGPATPDPVTCPFIVVRVPHSRGSAEVLALLGGDVLDG
jgi:hypothetical protein